jgi:hypothetical protein
LYRAIRTFASIRKNSAALRSGTYRELAVAAEHIAFVREAVSETGSTDRVVVAVNGGDAEAHVALGLNGTWKDVLNGDTCRIGDAGGIVTVPPHWLKIMVAGV